MRIAWSTSLLAMATALVSCKERDGSEPASSAAPAPAPAASVAPAPSAPNSSAPASASDAAPADEPDDARHTAVVACCRALSVEAEKSGPAQAKYTTAAAVCAGIARQVKKGAADPSAARSLIRAQLQGLAVPAVC
jgi:hypothetical protein